MTGVEREIHIEGLRRLATLDDLAIADLPDEDQNRIERLAAGLDWALDELAKATAERAARINLARTEIVLAELDLKLHKVERRREKLEAFRRKTQRDADALKKVLEEDPTHDGSEARQ